MNIEEKIEMIEFKMDLLFQNSELSRFLYESNISRQEYNSLKNILDDYRKKIDDGKKVDYSSFESEVFQVIPSIHNDYHFCEFVTELLAREGRWEEIFPALYGNIDKYKNRL